MAAAARATRRSQHAAVVPAGMQAVLSYTKGARCLECMRRGYASNLCMCCNMLVHKVCVVAVAAKKAFRAKRMSETG